jgi:hypothetical protein
MSNGELKQLDGLADETRAVVIEDRTKALMVATLTPIAERLPEYKKLAATIAVRNEAEAKQAAQAIENIRTDQKQAKEVVSDTIDMLYGLHRKWTGFRNMFVDNLEVYAKQIKQRVLAWQEDERRKAEEEQRRLQALAEQKAREERERLEAEAALAAPEEAEVLKAEAAEIITPQVKVEAPRSAVRMQRVWVVKSVDMDAFLSAAVMDNVLRGYIEVNQTDMQRSKAANPALVIPGVVFEQVVR